jgi:hypothetical protein
MGEEFELLSWEIREVSKAMELKDDYGFGFGKL